jgi:hypothetical protein
VVLSEFVVGASREMTGAAIAINEQRFAKPLPDPIPLKIQFPIGRFFDGVGFRPVLNSAR